VAIFSLVDAMLIRPFPLAEPHRLVEVWEEASRAGWPRNTPAPANFAETSQPLLHRFGGAPRRSFRHHR
jgi:hypothetical protein